MTTSDSYVSELYRETEAQSCEQRQTTSNRLFLRGFVVSKFVADFLLCVGTAFVAFLLLSHRNNSVRYPLGSELGVLCVAALFATTLLQRKSSYTAYDNLSPIHETAATVRMSIQSLLVIVPASFLLRLELPRSAMVLAFVLMPPLLAIQNKLFRRIILRVSYRSLDIGQIVADESDKMGGAVAPRRTRALADEKSTYAPRHYVFSKRLVDLLVSSVLLVLLLPVFILFALLICVSSPGPALFVQRRVGQNGKLFRMYKFRSMSSGARRYERSPQTSSDPRITKIGRILRQTSLDELPQLINVFRGEMSLVGPRPEMPFVVRSYNARQRQRLRVMPGITGLWQLSRDRAFPIHENIHHDLSYIRSRTLYMDLAILIHTLFFAMRGGV
ncbi:Undecaprenyl-phosphate galactose phosphotransferase [Terriglobus saanensis SP1PR4]|uniref:Undecaprenyl-phosphate galactose phosphotransferase n=2 Tax=Terriglobus saanensis TaxID=870903 RepID=E8V136_TERSS|nr:Undecaprenyl-phosphate galactose phosphotransferase [Terriglobus saanensis SP1PR4]